MQAATGCGQQQGNTFEEGKVNIPPSSSSAAATAFANRNRGSVFRKSAPAIINSTKPAVLHLAPDPFDPSALGFTTEIAARANTQQRAKVRSSHVYGPPIEDKNPWVGANNYKAVGNKVPLNRSFRCAVASPKLNS